MARRGGGGHASKLRKEEERVVGCQFGPSRDGGGVLREQGRRRPWRAARLALSDGEEGSALGNGEPNRGIEVGVVKG